VGRQDAKELLDGLAELVQQKKAEEDEENEEWEELFEKIDSVRALQETHGRRLDHFANRLDLYIQNLVIFNKQMEAMLDPPRAVCDDCTIWVSLSHRDHGPTYIQDLGWSVEGKKLYCPNCTRKRSGQ